MHALFFTVLLEVQIGRCKSQFCCFVTFSVGNAILQTFTPVGERGSVQISSANHRSKQVTIKSMKLAMKQDFKDSASYTIFLPRFWFFKLKSWRTSSKAGILSKVMEA